MQGTRDKALIIVGGGGGQRVFGGAAWFLEGMEGDQSSLTEYKGGNYRKLTVNLGGSLEYLGGFFFFFFLGGGVR